MTDIVHHIRAASPVTPPGDHPRGNYEHGTGARAPAGDRDVGLSDSATLTSEGTRPSVLLVATDTEWSARSFETLFGAHGFVVVHGTADRSLAGLALTVRPDAVILEHRLPSLDAVDALVRLHDDPRLGPGLPLLVVGASPIDRAQRLAIYTAGAWDYFTQPLDGEVVLRQLRTLIDVKRHIDRLQEATMVEALTGLYSSRGLAQRAREIGAAAYRRHESLACIAMSLEVQLPTGREELAPAATMSAARQLGLEWQRIGRATDALGHLGPAEFGIVAPGASAEGAQALHQRLRSVLESKPLDVGGVTCFVRIRAEIAGVDDYASAPVDAFELLRDASRALHNAQRHGDPLMAEPRS